MKSIEPSSVDSIVTDPPYELGFMGKAWDGTGIANSVEMWREALRVLKPGGHLLAFSGSRTYHRMVCAIEDAGFEIRDQIFWTFGSGFPKSHNLDKLRGDKTCGCAVPYTHETTQPPPERDVHSLRDADVSEALDSRQGRGALLQPGVSQQSTPGNRPEPSESNVGEKQPSLEGRRDAASPEGQLRASALREGASMGAADGAQGRLHHGAPAGDGRVVRDATDANGDGASPRPLADEQPAQQPRIVAGQSKPQAGGAWPVCGGCGKPILPKGLGTALKPAHEPIVVARKPLIGTVAANVLAHGTGAINVDGCRVPHVTIQGGSLAQNTHLRAQVNKSGGHIFSMGDDAYQADTLGRWPANLIHDGSDEVVAAFPEGRSSGVYSPKDSGRDRGKSVTRFSERGTPNSMYSDSGSAARFFYCAKASKADRSADNVHPTVKPTELMRYLVRLVTPPGGIVLDPFTGSGSTGKAAMLEGFRFVGCELSEEYAGIAKARIEEALRGLQNTFDFSESPLQSNAR